jgi:non-canonical (house-cleaning) NTP pyrophosphatase
LMVPQAIIDRMAATGLGHADVMDAVQKERGYRPAETWGTYTDGRLLREVSLEEAARNALMPLLCPEDYFP